LTRSCPRCSQAFVDFEGCGALSCPRCQCAFCAYCQADCDSDSQAHSHVARCPWNLRREVFSRKERFEEAQQQRRVRQIRAFIASLSPQTRKAVLDLCRVELEGLGLSLADLHDDEEAGAKI